MNIATSRIRDLNMSFYEVAIAESQNHDKDYHGLKMSVLRHLPDWINMTSQIHTSEVQNTFNMWPPRHESTR
jgi:hypothetical protein